MFVQMFTLISSRYFFQKWGIKGKHDNKKNNILTNTFVCIYILQIIYLLLFISHICRIETVNECKMCRNDKTTEFVGAKHRSDCVGKSLLDLERVLGMV